jgi:hypothetical protein
MPAYRFAMHHGAVETEELGFMKLLDEAEAVEIRSADNPRHAQ